MDSDVLSFKDAKPDQDFMRQIFSYDVRSFEATDSRILSEYISALAQYLIYFKSQQNVSKAELFKKQRELDLIVNQLLTKDVISKYKTKAAAEAFLISNTEELQDKEEYVEELKSEILLIDGIDKAIQEYIAALKRELTRREHEYFEIKSGRK